ncbi:unnamed protein product [Colias eurytheme]|nr:unnamed protein product [Colias eurytheme]
MIISDFGESYYDHACLIMHEKDVVDLELSGKSSMTNLRKWWYDWFLLSYTDERAQTFYTSTHALRMARAKQFYIYKSSIHPLSKFRKFWDYFIVLVVVVNMLMFYHSTSITYGNWEWQTYIFNVGLDFVLFLDIYINMRTGYIHDNSKRIILNSRKVMIYYASTKLFAHALGSIPLEGILFLRYGANINCAICKANKFVAVLELLCIFRFYRLFDATSRWGMDKRCIKTCCFLKFLRISILGFISMVIFMHVSDIISVLTVIQTGKLDSRSYYASVLDIKYGSDTPPPNSVFYCLEFARICKSFLLFSFSLIPRTYFPDKMTALVAYLIAMIFYMWSIVECYIFLSINKFPQEQMLTCVDRTMTLVRWRKLSDSFSRKLMRYFRFNMTKLTITEKQNGIYKSLPKSLKRDIAISCYSRMIIRIPYFAEWPTEVIEEMVMLLQEEIYLEGDMVAEASVPSDGLIIVVVGVLAIYSIRNEEVGHLIDGDYFCELCLVTDREIRMSSVVAITPCKLLFLEKITFRKMMREYPDLFYDLKKALNAKYRSQRRATVDPMPI